MSQIKHTKYSHRFLARFVIEAKTPLSVGSGEKDIITDALVTKDVNGMPYIPGTAIAGVLRGMLGEEVDKNTLFGFQQGVDGLGSRIIFTEAKILKSNGDVVDGLDMNVLNDPLLKDYKELPIRQHARINASGVTVDKGKFDEQVVYAGTRFCFEMEVVSDGSDKKNFDDVLNTIQSRTFRLGGGTRCGFGEIEVKKLFKAEIDLNHNIQLYLDKSSNLLKSGSWSGWKPVEDVRDTAQSAWIKYELSIKPEDFFLFGSGFGDDDVDITPVKGKKVIWKDGTGLLQDNLVLIPATAVKGALSHRVAFHWNKLNGLTAENLRPSIDLIRNDNTMDASTQSKKIEELKDSFSGKKNKAVNTLFGSEGERSGEKMENQRRGNLLFSDVIAPGSYDKVLNHVSIDRFTGGAIDGALFSEKNTYGRGNVYTMTIWANKEALSDSNIELSLENALIDICNGLLPLGGGVNRGNGTFTGRLTKDENVLYEYSE